MTHCYKCDLICTAFSKFVTFNQETMLFICAHVTHVNYSFTVYSLFQDLMKKMKPEKLQDLVLKLVDREPGLLFDLLKGVEDSNDGIPKPGPSRSGHTPTWCKCSYCREMPSDMEHKCCSCLPRNCVSQRE